MAVTCNSLEGLHHSVLHLCCSLFSIYVKCKCLDEILVLEYLCLYCIFMYFATVAVNDVSNEQFKGMLDPRISQ